VVEADPARRKLFWWLVFVAALTLVAWLSSLSTAPGNDNILYKYSTAVSSAVVYAVLLVAALAIAGRSTGLLALRRPPSWLRALGLAVLVFVLAELAIQLMEPFLHGSREQGLVPKRWERSHAAEYGANWIVVAGVAPVVEELIYRGLGFSLLERYGKWVAIIAVGVLFGASHGLLRAWPELSVLGCGLAWLRLRTRSVYPGMILHSTFNTLALAAVFFHTR